MVATPNLFFTFYFLVCHLVMISVVTNGNSTENFRELGHLIKYKNLMWLFYFFSLFFFFMIYLFIIIIMIIILYIFVSFWRIEIFVYIAYLYTWILNHKVNDIVIYIYIYIYIYIWFLSICLQEGVWVCIILPSHTHTVCMTWVRPYTRDWVPLELEGIVYQCHNGCMSQVVVVRTPTRVCLLHWYFHLLLFTNCRGKCHEVGHSSSDLYI